jgi:ring-1,2-phenylacetyl-CoA epoxidase subunit PaaE
VNLILKNKYKDITIEKFYLCGPEANDPDRKRHTRKQRCKEKTFLFELFTPPSEVENSDASE